jgi:Tannase and feruloyl esterase
MPVKIKPLTARSFLCAACSLVRAVATAAPTCSSLTRLIIPNTAVTSAVDVSAGAFTPPGAAGSFDLPEFCRVMAVSRPVNDSEIHFELWMPAPADWNRKFEGTGNGGFSGSLSYSMMAEALKRGYATAGSDTGHVPDDLTFGVGHPDKIDDWAFRAVHVMTETAKLIVRDYYGRLPQYSYFTGCSTGGQQALTEATRAVPSGSASIRSGVAWRRRLTRRDRSADLLERARRLRWSASVFECARWVCHARRVSAVLSRCTCAVLPSILRVPSATEPGVRSVGRLSIRVWSRFLRSFLLPVWLRRSLLPAL